MHEEDGIEAAKSSKGKAAEEEKEKQNEQAELCDAEDRIEDTDIFADLNDAQIEAVTQTEGFVRVIAGAGSGKTRALSRRFAYLVNEAGILPGNILCVTFTNKSANEMRRRIHQLTGDNDTGYVCTFHSFCVSVLQEDSYAVQYPKRFLVLDNADIDSMLKVIYEERGLSLRDMTFGRARDMIEIKKLFKEPAYYQDMIAMPLENLRQKYLAAASVEDIIFYGYLYQEKKCFGLDYNDLIKYTLYIFQENPEIRLKWQKRLAYIMIDEFQDIDELQYKLMEVLCAYHKNLFVVGDPDQTIYTWRGANVRYLLQFDRNFPGTRSIMMMQNYRSTPQIITAANALINRNRNRIKKELQPMLAEGKPVTWQHCRDVRQEANWIANTIKALARQNETGSNGEKEFAFQDITILYRAHYVTRTLEEVFRKEEIPYQLYSGVPFFDRMEIKDALSYLRMVIFQDDLSFQRIANVPKRNLGERRMRYLREYADAQETSLYTALLNNLEEPLFQGTAAKQFVQLVERFSSKSNMQASELLAALLDESGYEEMLRTEGSQERLDNLAELKQSVYEYEANCGEESSAEDYLAHLAFFTNQDAADRRNAVKLMTVHTAKGLEFPYVFLCEMNEGIFPSRKTLTPEGMEEERRLCFVALTRAEKQLWISEAEGRNIDGSIRYPSRFLFDIGKENLLCEEEPPEQFLEAARAQIRVAERTLVQDAALPVFSEGDRIRHKIFGLGVIESVDEDAHAYLIRFDRMETPRKLSFRIHLQKEEAKRN